MNTHTNPSPTTHPTTDPAMTGLDTGFDTDEAAQLFGLAAEVVTEAHVAAEAIRAINHATITRKPALPAPHLYPVLAELSRVGHGLQQALVQLGDHLAESVSNYELYQCDGTDPADATAAAMILLSLGSQYASQLALTVDQAESAIAAQGYRTDDDRAIAADDVEEAGR